MFLLLQEAKEQLSPLSVALERLQQEKQELLDRKRQRQEEGLEKVRGDANPPRLWPAGETVLLPWLLSAVNR